MFIFVDTTSLAQGPRIACFACLTSRTSRQCGGVGQNSFLSWEFKGPVGGGWALGGVPLNCHDIGDVHNDKNLFLRYILRFPKCPKTFANGLELQDIQIYEI